MALSLSIWLVGAALVSAAQSPASVAADAPRVEQPPPVPWIRRHPPRRHTLELGLAFGPLFPSARHGLIDDQIYAESGGTFFQRYSSAISQFDLRLAYFPLAFLGLEVEGGIAPTYTQELKERANLYGFRGHVIAQLARWSVAPYVLAGGGLLGTGGALGSDIDPAGHFGAGAKFFANDRAILRVDVRDAIARGVAVGAAHYVQLTFGVSFGVGLGRGAQRRLTAR